METKSNNKNEQKNTFRNGAGYFGTTIGSVLEIEKAIEPLCNNVKDYLKDNLSADYHLEFVCLDDYHEDNLEINLSVSAVSLGNYNDGLKTKEDITLYPIFNSAPISFNVNDIGKYGYCHPVAKKDEELYLYCVAIENINKIKSSSNIITKILYIDSLYEYLSRLFVLCIGSYEKCVATDKRYTITAQILDTKRDSLYTAMNKCIRDCYNNKNDISYIIKNQDIDEMKFTIINDLNEIEYELNPLLRMCYNLMYKSFRVVIEFYIHSKKGLYDFNNTKNFIGVKIGTINYNGQDTKCRISAYNIDQDINGGYDNIYVMVKNILLSEIDNFIDTCMKLDNNFDCLDNDVYIDMSMSDLKVSRYNDFVNTKRMTLSNYTSDEIIDAMNEYDLKDIFTSIINKAKNDRK